MPERETAKRLTVASPFWPTGADMADVAQGLFSRCGGRPDHVRLISVADVDGEGVVRPMLPAALVQAMLDRGAVVSVAAATPDYGCMAAPPKDADGEYDHVAARQDVGPAGRRDLHAKVLLAEGGSTSVLAIGSVNLTRKGLGLVPTGNIEAGVQYTVDRPRASSLRELVAFAGPYVRIDRSPELHVVPPEPFDGDGGGGQWPGFLVSLSASGTRLTLLGLRGSWPGPVVIRMRDQRSRLVGRAEWFADWVVAVSGGGEALCLAPFHTLCRRRS